MDRGDIEFTVCELNCHTSHDEPASPQHERKPRFSSFKKSAAISKAVRNKLNLSKSGEKQHQSSTEKQGSCSAEGSNSFDASMEKCDNAEHTKVSEQHDNYSATTPTSAKSVPGKVVKKKSKLCLLL